MPLRKSPGHTTPDGRRGKVLRAGWAATEEPVQEAIVEARQERRG